MAIDQEIPIGRVLVLTDARFKQRSAQPDPGTVLQEAHERDSSSTGRAAVAGFRIERWTMFVDSKLEAAPVESPESYTRLPESDPDGHLRKAAIFGRGPVEKDFLPRGPDARADRVRKNLGSHGPQANTKVSGEVSARARSGAGPHNVHRLGPPRPRRPARSDAPSEPRWTAQTPRLHRDRTGCPGNRFRNTENSSHSNSYPQRANVFLAPIR